MKQAGAEYESQSASNFPVPVEPNTRVPNVTLVVPCYNEQEVLPETAKRLGSILRDMCRRRKISGQSTICFVDDGSTDQTWDVIEQLVAADPYIEGLKLSRNCGHQNALLAGLFNASGDVVISIDADLQDDLEAIEAMIDANSAGSDIVFGVRKNRETDTFFKRFTAESYYRVLRIMGVDIVFNHADYRLMSRRAVNALKEFDEVNIFLRAIIPQIGLKSSIVFYSRAARFAGVSKYPVGKMLHLAVEGITSFSVTPLRMITMAGVVVSLVSFGTALWATAVALYNPAAVPGWASTVLPIYLLGGIQLLGIGVIGEYLAKIYMETKRRPRYIIEKNIRGPF
jgi:glycosyltransferase involved in cell wall biosynthesis